jgi:hypothetical protein
MAIAFGLRYAPSQPAGPQDSASAEAHCLLQASKAENTPAAFLESARGIGLDKSPDALAINRNPL